MKKLVLRLRETPTNDWYEHLDEILNLNRKFQVINVLDDLKGFRSDSVLHSQVQARAIMKLAARHGSQVRKLFIENVEFDCPEDIKKIVINMPMLEELQVKNLEISTNYEEAPLVIQPVLLKSLKTLIFSYSYSIILNNFTLPNITSLELIYPFPYGEFDNFMSLLKLDKLDSLSITQPDAELFRHQSEFATFKLKKLEVCFGQSMYRDVEGEADFLTFLKSQAPTLNHLKLIGRFEAEVILTAVTKVKNLKSLTTDLGNFPDDEEFFSKFEPLIGLKELGLDFVGTSNVHKLIYKKCPNIESFNDWYGSVGDRTMLPFLAINNPHLRKLPIIESIRMCDCKLKFAFLLQLHVTTIESWEALTAFIAFNSTIHTLRVDAIFISHINDIQALISLPNLKHLRLRGDLESMRMVYNMVKTDSKGLKTLELNVSSIYRIAGGFRFEFPEDSNGWKLAREFFDQMQSPELLSKRVRYQ